MKYAGLSEISQQAGYLSNSPYRHSNTLIQQNINSGAETPYKEL